MKNHQDVFLSNYSIILLLYSSWGYKIFMVVWQKYHKITWESIRFSCNSVNQNHSWQKNLQGHREWEWLTLGTFNLKYGKSKVFPKGTAGESGHEMPCPISSENRKQEDWGLHLINFLLGRNSRHSPFQCSGKWVVLRALRFLVLYFPSLCPVTFAASTCHSNHTSRSAPPRAVFGGVLVIISKK